MSGDNSPDEAAWRELVESYELSAGTEPGSAPWPDRENLSEPPAGPQGRPGQQPAAGKSSPGENEESPASAASQGTAGSGTADSGTTSSSGTTSGSGTAKQDTAKPQTAKPETAGPSAVSQDTAQDAGNGTAGRDPAGPAGSQVSPAAPGQRPGPGPGGAARPAADRARIVRHADPLAWRPATSQEAAGDEDERYVPPLAPPLRLDPVAKGAWAALFGGPGYLLLATIMSWQVTGWAALLAIVAFVGGFAIVFLRLGDGPPRGDGPDNGAVV